MYKLVKIHIQSYIQAIILYTYELSHALNHAAHTHADPHWTHVCTHTSDLLTYRFQFRQLRTLQRCLHHKLFIVIVIVSTPGVHNHIGHGLPAAGPEQREPDGLAGPAHLLPVLPLARLLTPHAH